MNYTMLQSWPRLLVVLCLLGAAACTPEVGRNAADLILENGTIYTVNDAAPTAEAVAVKDGRIVYVGAAEGLEEYRGKDTQVIDLQGKTMTPGLIEGHAHIIGVGTKRMQLDLQGISSYEAMVDSVRAAAARLQPGQWILGRGWHQDKWDSLPYMVQGFPVHDALSEAAPDNPVWLGHASGHMSIANAKTMELAGITRETASPEGGEIIRDFRGNATGVFNERAEVLIDKFVPEVDHRKALLTALSECAENGITSLHNAGSPSQDIEIFKEFAEDGLLTTRLYVMLSGRDRPLLERYYESGPEIGLGNNFLTIRSIKMYGDGALGSRGAWLIEPYTDEPSTYGMATTPMEDIGQIAREGLQHGFQVNTHAIGDRTNREVLDQYAAAFAQYPEQSQDHRFRIEHAQHLSEPDIYRFADMGVIPSMQAIHMSSDRSWAIERLGQERIEIGAYVWQKLLESGVPIINGTDAPVEPIDPIACFYASVTRRTLKGTPEGGYEPEQRMTREQALRSYTLDAAYGAFEEDIKGSIEVGKMADFTVYSQDLMQVPDEELLLTEIEMTIVDGKVVYRKL